MVNGTVLKHNKNTVNAYNSQNTMRLPLDDSQAEDLILTLTDELLKPCKPCLDIVIRLQINNPKRITFSDVKRTAEIKLGFSMGADSLI